MNVLELDDLVYTYPQVADPNFQNLISGKQEFAELGSSLREPRPGPGGLYKHQELIRRFILFYDRLLVNHRTGTGKSCAAFGAAETLKQGIINVVADFINIYVKPARTNIKKIIWISMGPTLVRETQKQLVCKCSVPGEYITEKVEAAETVKAQTTRINKNVNRFYRIVGVQKFVNDFLGEYGTSSGLDLARVRADYSDCMFVVDEVQYMHASLTDDTPETKKRNYDALWAIFHTVERSKIMLLTATPMINQASEIVPVMNLILPADLQMDENVNYDTVSLEEVERYFRGRVSYVREADTGATPIYHGVPLLGANGEPLIHTVGTQIYPSHLTCYTTEMSELQRDVYLNLVERGIEVTNETDTKKNAFDVKTRQISNFVFPDGTYGKTGASRWLNQSKETVYTIKPDYRPQLEEYLESTDRLGELSSKFAAIIRLARRGLMYQQIVFIPNGGFFVVEDKVDETTVVLVAVQNEVFGSPYVTAPEAGTVVPRGYPMVWGGQRRVRAGREMIVGDPDIQILATISEEFVQPDLGESVRVSIFYQPEVGAPGFRLVRGEFVGVPNVGIYQVRDIDGSVAEILLVKAELGPGEVVPGYVVCVPASEAPTETGETDYVATLWQLAGVLEPFTVPAPNERVTVHVTSTASSGSCFCYSDFKKSGGVFLLSLCFTYQGFEQYSDPTSAFISTEKRRLAPYCASSQSDTKTRTVRIPKKPRFAIIVPKTKPTILELFNSYENRYGDYIKVLIGSPVAKVGLNLENCLQFHLIGPPWNYANMYQAISRVLRATSHDRLLAEKKEALRLQNPDSDLSQVTIDVDMYLHAATITGASSLDLELYRRIERKDIPIKRLERFLKQTAIDCQIHRNRNVRPGDQPGTQVCDYDICDYRCVGNLEDPQAGVVRDFSSFNVLYSDGLISTIMSRISLFFRSHYSLSLEQLTEAVYQSDPDVYGVYPNFSGYVVEAVERLIKTKVPIYNRFGQESYLQERTGQVFLVREYPSEVAAGEAGGYLSGPALTIYTEALVAIRENRLEDISSDLIVDVQDPKIKAIIRGPADDPELIRKIRELAPESQARLLEDVTTRGDDNGDPFPTMPVIEAYYSGLGLLYEFREPLEAIMYEKGFQDNPDRNQGYDVEGNLLPRPPARRGRPPNNPSKNRPGAPPIREYIRSVIEDDEEDEEVERNEGEVRDELGIRFAEKVKIHRIYQVLERLVKYGAAQREAKVVGRLRILKPSEGQGWRDLLPQEEVAYPELIIERKSEAYRRFKVANPLHGTVLPGDGKFRIVDPRFTGSGIVCGTGRAGHPPYLVELLCHLGVEPPRRPITVSQQQIRNYLQKAGYAMDGKSDEDATCAYLWLNSDLKAPGLCQELEEFMDENGLIWRGDE